MKKEEFMLPLSKTPYEPAVWSSAKVQNDYLIIDGINKYSVPFDLIGEQVDIRLTKGSHLYQGTCAAQSSEVSFIVLD